MHKRANYSNCPDGARHVWHWAGGTVTEWKTGRQVSDRKCENCGLVKQVFETTGHRVNR